MTEIQLRRIVDRTSQEDGKQLSGGDEVMTKDGVTISKFSKEVMGLGKDVYEEEGIAPTILKKVYILYILYDRYVEPDSVFPVSNGAPRIMTKFKDQPYTYELWLPWRVLASTGPVLHSTHFFPGTMVLWRVLW